MCPHWHAHHQGYSNSLGSVGAQPMVVEVYVGLLHVPDEVGDGHYAHQFAGLQVQLLLSSGEKFLGICKKKKKMPEEEAEFLFFLCLIFLLTQTTFDSDWCPLCLRV